MSYFHILDLELLFEQNKSKKLVRTQNLEFIFHKNKRLLQNQYGKYEICRKIKKIIDV